MTTLLLGEGGETTTLLTVLGLVAATIGSSLTALFGYLAVRDKLKFDARTATLQKDCEQCKKDREEDRAELIGVKAEMIETRTRLEAEQVARARHEGELAAMRQVVDDLRGRNNAKENGP